MASNSVSTSSRRRLVRHRRLLSRTLKEVQVSEISPIISSAYPITFPSWRMRLASVFTWTASNSSHTFTSSCFPLTHLGSTNRLTNGIISFSDIANRSNQNPSLIIFCQNNLVENKSDKSVYSKLTINTYGLKSKPPALWVCINNAH